MHHQPYHQPPWPFAAVHSESPIWPFQPLCGAAFPIVVKQI